MPTEIGRIALALVPPGSMRKLHHPPYHVLVTNVGGEVFAIEDGCPHSGWSLSEGSLEGSTVTCAGHGWCIDVRDGRVLLPPIGEQNVVYRAEIVGDEVVVFSD